MDEMYKVSEDHRIQTHVNYNQFFHPNICHVCKSTDRSNLMVCAQCRMISYCSEEHKKQHRRDHEDICTLITRFINEDPEWDTRRLGFDEWMKKQENLMRIIEAALGRKLKMYEVQMFMFAKVCFICRQRCNLSTCRKCICTSYCEDHMAEKSSHLFVCDDLALSLNLDIIFLEKKAWETIYISIRFLKFPSKKKPFADMDSFCHKYYKELKKHKRWNFNVYCLTDYVSGPLTLYNALQSANLFRPKKIMHIFIIHIIAADYMDKRNFPAWELFLHFLNEKVKLVIVMLGPQLQYKTNEYNLCSHCRAANKRLIFRSFPLLYHNFVHHINYKQPNIIVGFQAEFGYDETMSESIRAIQAQNCPLLLIAKSRLRGYWDMIKIEKVLGTSVKPIFHSENYFVSCRPYRDFNTGYVFLPNSYLIMYKNLNVPNKPIKASTNVHTYF